MTIPLPEIIDTTKCRDVVASKCSVSNFLYGVEKAGLSNLVPNCPARLLVLKQRDQLFPLTVNESSSGGSYVVQPAQCLYRIRTGSASTCWIQIFSAAPESGTHGNWLAIVSSGYQPSRNARQFLRSDKPPWKLEWTEPRRDPQVPD